MDLEQIEELDFVQNLVKLQLEQHASIVTNRHIDSGMNFAKIFFNVFKNLESLTVDSTSTLKVFSEEPINPYADKIVLKIMKKLNGKESVGDVSANETESMSPIEQVIS